MSNTSDVPLIDRPISHSQVSGYIRCSKQFELERISRYPSPPTWFFIGGNAVHSATEHLDKLFPDISEATEDDAQNLWDVCFDEEIDKAFQVWPFEEQWLKFGRKPADQGYDYWNARGSMGVGAYLRWRHDNPDWVVESIEEEFTVPVGRYELTGRIDRVFNTPDGLVVVDIKSGSKRPSSALQLGLYRMAYERSHGAPEGSLVASAGYFMTKDGELYLQDISPFTDALLERILVSYRHGIEQGIFLPNVGDACYHCPMKQACATVSGVTPESLRYDSLLKENASA